MMNFLLRLRKACAILFHKEQPDGEAAFYHEPKLSGFSDLDRLAIWTSQREWCRSDGTQLFFRFLKDEKEFAMQALEALDMDSPGFDKKSRALLARLRDIRSFLRYPKMVDIKVAELEKKCEKLLK